MAAETRPQTTDSILKSSQLLVKITTHFALPAGYFACQFFKGNGILKQYTVCIWFLSKVKHLFLTSNVLTTVKPPHLHACEC